MGRRVALAVAVLLFVLGPPNQGQDRDTYNVSVRSTHVSFGTEVRDPSEAHGVAMKGGSDGAQEERSGVASRGVPAPHWYPNLITVVDNDGFMVGYDNHVRTTSSAISEFPN